MCGCGIWGFGSVWPWGGAGLWVDLTWEDFSNFNNPTKWSCGVSENMEKFLQWCFIHHWEAKTKPHSGVNLLRIWQITWRGAGGTMKSLCHSKWPPACPASVSPFSWEGEALPSVLGPSPWSMDVQQDPSPGPLPTSVFPLSPWWFNIRILQPPPPLDTPGPPH